MDNEKDTMAPNMIDIRPELARSCRRKGSAPTVTWLLLWQ